MLEWFICHSRCYNTLSEGIVGEASNIAGFFCSNNKLLYGSFVHVVLYRCSKGIISKANNNFPMVDGDGT